MLVLGRKTGESIVINGSIEVCILEVNDGIVKIGINAPKSVRIVRKELITEVKSENIESMKNVNDLMKQITTKEEK